MKLICIKPPYKFKTHDDFDHITDGYSLNVHWVHKISRVAFSLSIALYAHHK